MYKTFCLDGLYYIYIPKFLVFIPSLVKKISLYLRPETEETPTGERRGGTGRESDFSFQIC